LYRLFRFLTTQYLRVIIGWSGNLFKRERERGIEKEKEKEKEKEMGSKATLRYAQQSNAGLFGITLLDLYHLKIVRLFP
jgi:hypothetical protein